MYFVMHPATLEASHAEEIDSILASHKQVLRAHKDEIKSMEQNFFNQTSSRLTELSEAHAEIVLGLQQQVEQARDDKERLRQELESKYATKISILNVQIEDLKKGTENKHFVVLSYLSFDAIPNDTTRIISYPTISYQMTS